MRKTFMTLLALCLACGLAACDDSASTPADTGTAPASAAPAATDAAADVLADPTAGGAGAADAACCKKDAAACCKEGGAQCAGDCACKQASDKPACLCAQGKAGAPVWCEACDKGYAHGKEVCCKNCVKDAQAEAKADSGQ